jgi:hypothetical protein
MTVFARLTRFSGDMPTVGRETMPATHQTEIYGKFHFSERASHTKTELYCGYSFKSNFSSHKNFVYKIVTFCLDYVQYSIQASLF